MRRSALRRQSLSVLYLLLGFLAVGGWVGHSYVHLEGGPHSDDCLLCHVGHQMQEAEAPQPIKRPTARGSEPAEPPVREAPRSSPL